MKVIVKPATTLTKEMTESKSICLRAVCFFLCIPSGGALLAKVYGLAPMPVGAIAVALPGCAVLVGIWLWARRSGKQQLADALAIGFTGGLLGTLAYDIARVPFHLGGQRIFAQISAYGVWIAEAESSSRFTEIIGWAYHFSNGITFGMMYALWMRQRHWGWAILWGLVLETIALLSPFARIFSLSGNYSAMSIAYLGHVAYGLPLGWLTYKWDETRAQLAAMNAIHRGLLLLIGIALLLWPLLSPVNLRQDARATKGEFRVEGHRLNPDWLRIERGGTLQVYNPEPERIRVRVKQREQTIQLEGQQRATLSFPEPGIYQVYVETDQRSQSSFVIVEPVEELK